MPKSIYYAGHLADLALVKTFKQRNGVLMRLPKDGPDENTRNLIADRLHAMSLRMSVDQFLGLKVRPATELETAQYNAAVARQERLKLRAKIEHTLGEMRDSAAYVREQRKHIKKLTREIESVERCMLDEQAQIEAMTAKIKNLDNSVDAAERELRQAKRRAKAKASK